ncbi:putative branched-chain amino acid transport ATP-binding ABC transporter [Fulvimarina pelagi HTCC2506]|uniref:Putative branched-chain amino acid transport ATP-binding ABC transporter n=1 Tax=Fulvimarina pelagi HTCC2506 TaxID=314231 RepID=Q0FY60_9HYPH|nr:ABC transporter ATP-binding protein [Fulvimarina pelagi]EAU39882.1 putative branched-chain amino acid transport ATP-binding ABC transporter [Fulvimarina pelagi HTCC2506]
MAEQLVVDRLTKTFGGIVALNGVELAFSAGELIGLIGPNGSGKTTLLNIVSGYYTADRGQITYENQPIAGTSPHKLARIGIGRSFQVTKVFRRLTVMENMLVSGLSDWSETRSQASERATAILEDLKLTRLRDERASNLSGGQLKLLEFARIMMLQPKLLLLDEPFGGVHPELKRFMYDCIRKWNAAGITIILISHDMGSIFELCRRVVTLSYGDIICDGTPEETRADKGVLEAYLGEHHASA